MKARDLLKSEHPLFPTFSWWVKNNCGDDSLTVRKARKFLAAHPYYAEEPKKAA
jgi:hypothetical protein